MPPIPVEVDLPGHEDWLKGGYKVAKHYGPGPHKSGSPQTVHAWNRHRRAAATLADWMRRHPDGDPEVFKVAEQYLADNNRLSLRIIPERTLDPVHGRWIANAYDDAPDNTHDPATRNAYAAFNREVRAQREALEAAGYQFIPWDRPGQPYRNSKQMRDDVRKNKRLYYFKTEHGSPIHALMTNEDNDNFRAVHDLFGHALGGNSFWAKGETNAFLDHSQMFSETARSAMVTETLAQNAWLNFSQSNDGRASEDKEFPVQKATLIDPEYYQWLYEGTVMEEEVERVEKALDPETRDYTRDARDLDPFPPITPPIPPADPDFDDPYHHCPGHRTGHHAKEVGID